MVNYKEKVCLLCGEEYKPTSPKQKYCIKCKDDGRRISDRKRDRIRHRKKYNYKKYIRRCKICGTKFSTHYSKKNYCGNKKCDKLRIQIKNKKTHATRSKTGMIIKGKRYYKENREKCLQRKADYYREKNPNAKPYVFGKYNKLTIDYVRNYIEERGYSLLSNEYINNNSKLLLECPEGHKWETTFHNFEDVGDVEGSRCLQCYINGNYVSKLEQRVRNFLEENYPHIDVVYNDRIQIKPKELDFYFPDSKLAVEVCGLYWHGEISSGRDRQYHYNKMIECFNKGVRLITVFEDELNNNFDIVMSRILQALGVHKRRIFARKCIVKEIDTSLANKFFVKCHSQGRSTSLKVWGLFYHDELVSVCSVGKILRKHTSSADTLELKRFCTLPYVSIVGGISKLFKKAKQFAIDEGYTLIKSYCDMRYSNIFKPVYEILDFKLMGLTKYTPHYFKNGVRYRNYSLRKTPEERLLNKTEYQLRKEQGYDRIWDCGHRTYVYVIN